MLTVLCGDALEKLRELSDESVQCCVTSPPYWGLRDYGTAQWEGGEKDCTHEPPQEWIDHNFNAKSAFGNGATTQSSTAKGRWYSPDGGCPSCGARRIDSQLGLEKTPEEYVAKMVEVFREVRRVLRKDGTLWLNLGDSYCGTGSKGDCTDPKYAKGRNGQKVALNNKIEGLKQKDLVGIPWRVAFALQADGWVLRSDVIWNKPNPMPESVTDRPTKSHEYLFLFSKAKWIGEDRRRFADISDDDARWLALFLDTEGNICCKRVKAEGRGDHFGAQICFASCNRDLVDTAQRIIGAGAVLTRKGKNAPMFYLQLSNNQAADLLHRLWQFLIVKQRQASLAIYLQNVIADSGHERRTKVGRLRGRARGDEYTNELIRIWATMKQLNHFGNPDLSWMPRPKFGRWDSESYFYDSQAILEPSIYCEIDPRPSELVRGREFGYDTKLDKTPRPIYKDARSYNGKHCDKQRGHGRRHAGFNDRWDAMEKSEQCSGFRNKRTVWTVATSPYPEAHFATYPPDLIKPCILAGAKPGDTVLDPFGGSGTTGQVAIELGRKAILIELNPKYVELIKERCNVTVGLPLA